MHHAPVSGKHFGRLDPFVFGEVGGNVDVFVVVHGGSTHQKLGNGQHHVGLDVPAFREYGSRRQILGVSFFGSGSHPGIDGGDLGVGQPRIINEIAHLGVGMPGRHLAIHHRITNRPRPGTGVLISHQRHGSDVVGTMADHAVLEENRGHVPVEGDFLGSARVLSYCFRGHTTQCG